MSHVLGRKLRRDVWRQRGQFAAVIVVIAMGIAVFVAASDAYRNLNDSFDRAYATQRLPDVVLTGPAAASLAADAANLPGDPLVTSRVQADVGARVGEHALLGRVVSVPDGAQPDVARLAVALGPPTGDGEVLVEQHLADHFGSVPATRSSSSARRVATGAVSGTGLSTEYFWPARSQQEVMTSAEQFGVVFAPESLVRQLTADPQAQLALYARDRSRAGQLVAAATDLARTHDLVAAARTDQPSYVALDQDVQTFGQFANLLPVLFLVAGVLGAFIVLSRLVHAQRAVIGTLTANGIAPATFRRHYLSFGLLAGIAAVPFGLAGGYAVGAWFTTQYTNALGLPLHVVSLHPATLLIASVAGIAAAGLAAWGPARAAARVAPAEAMRVAPPGTAPGRSSSGSSRPCITSRHGGGWCCAVSAATAAAPCSRSPASPSRSAWSSSSPVCATPCRACSTVSTAPSTVPTASSTPTLAKRHAARRRSPRPRRRGRGAIRPRRGQPDRGRPPPRHHRCGDCPRTRRCTASSPPTATNCPFATAAACCSAPASGTSSTSRSATP